MISSISKSPNFGTKTKVLTSIMEMEVCLYWTKGLQKTLKWLSESTKIYNFAFKSLPLPEVCKTSNEVFRSYNNNKILYGKKKKKSYTQVMCRQVSESKLEIHFIIF